MDCVLAAMEYSRITRSMMHSEDSRISRSGSVSSVDQESMTSPKSGGAFLQRRGSGGSISGRSDTSCTKENDHASARHKKSQRHPLKMVDGIRLEDGLWTKHIQTSGTSCTADLISSPPEKSCMVGRKRRRSSCRSSCSTASDDVVTHSEHRDT
jgi:hypothetical protein